MELWLTEEHTPGYRVQWCVNRVLYRTQSRYQDIAIVELREFGRALILDGIVQTTVADEFHYHEMIAHVPLCAHPNPRSVLVIGGGDGGTVREVLKHSPVQHVVLVEIDEAVIEACREHLPELSAGLADPRVDIVIADGRKYLESCIDEFDVILVDSSDPIGPAADLFVADFYASIFTALKNDGLFVAQTESPLFYRDLFCRIVKNIRCLFPIVRPYLTVVPTYTSGYWSFTVGSKKYDPERPLRQVESGQLRCYGPAVHRAVFALPPVVSDLIPPLARETEKRLAPAKGDRR
jgi:spermidine synthase